jgi:hypothetical protein
MTAARQCQVNRRPEITTWLSSQAFAVPDYSAICSSRKRMFLRLAPQAGTAVSARRRLARDKGDERDLQPLTY